MELTFPKLHIETFEHPLRAAPGGKEAGQPQFGVINAEYFLVAEDFPCYTDNFFHNKKSLRKKRGHYDRRGLRGRCYWMGGATPGTGG